MDTSAASRFRESFATPRSLAREDQFLGDLLAPRLSRLDAFHTEHAVAARANYNQVKELHNQHSDLATERSAKADEHRDQRRHLKQRLAELEEAAAATQGENYRLEYTARHLRDPEPSPFERGARAAEVRNLVKSQMASVWSRLDTEINGIQEKWARSAHGPSQHDPRPVLPRSQDEWLYRGRMVPSTARELPSSPRVLSVPDSLSTPRTGRLRDTEGTMERHSDASVDALLAKMEERRRQRGQYLQGKQRPDELSELHRDESESVVSRRSQNSERCQAAYQKMRAQMREDAATGGLRGPREEHEQRSRKGMELLDDVHLSSTSTPSQSRPGLVPKLNLAMLQPPEPSSEPLTGRPFGEPEHASLSFKTLDQISARRSLKLTGALTARVHSLEDQIQEDEQQHQEVAARIGASVAAHEEQLQRIQSEHRNLEHTVARLQGGASISARAHAAAVHRELPDYDSSAWTLPAAPDNTGREEHIRGLVSGAFGQAKRRFEAQFAQVKSAMLQPVAQERATWAPTLYHRRRMIKAKASSAAPAPPALEIEAGDGTAFGREQAEEQLQLERRSKDVASERGAKGADVFRVYRKPQPREAPAPPQSGGTHQGAPESPRTPVQGLGVIGLPKSPRYVGSNARPLAQSVH